MISISIFLKALRFSGCLLLYHDFDNTNVMVNNLQLRKAGFASKMVRLVTDIGNKLLGDYISSCQICRVWFSKSNYG